MNAQLPLARISDDEFERLVGKGAAEVLGRVELRDGALHRTNAQYVPHMRMKMTVYDALKAAIASSGLPLEIGSEGTVRYERGFSPLPDVVVWTPTPTTTSIPGLAVKLIVEVADITLADDLGIKRTDYAKAGLPEYWVVDLGARAFHRFSAPAADGYARAAVFREGEQVASETLAGVAIRLAFPVSS